MDKKVVWLVALTVAAVVIVALLPKEKEKYAFELKKRFLSMPEQMIFTYLIEMGYIPCPKVRIADFMYRTDKKESISKISQRSVDFLVCDDKLNYAFVVLMRKKSDRRTKAVMYLKTLFEKVGLPAYIVSSKEELSTLLKKESNKSDNN